MLQHPLVQVFGVRALNFLFDSVTRRKPSEQLKAVQLKEEMEAVERLQAAFCTLPKTTGTAIVSVTALNSGSAPATTAVQPRVEGMATTADTILTQRQRLGLELYQFQLDLQDGCKIQGKPCDCCLKHSTLGLEGLARETMAMRPLLPAWSTMPQDLADVIQWVTTYSERLTPEASASGQWEDWYRNEAAPWTRQMRRRVMGTENVTALVPTAVVQRDQALAERVKTGELTREQAVKELTATKESD